MSEIQGQLRYARRPPVWRRFIASRGDGMCLGNATLLGALRFCVRETLAGRGPCRIWLPGSRR